MKVLFVTGAGISANAGIPTYRAAGSSWVNKDLEKKSRSNRYGNHLHELWDDHWGPLATLMRRADPTIAHRAIAEFQKNHEAIIATQNIDDLHERAGSDNVAHLHGTMKSLCMRCKKSNVSPWIGAGPPICNECGSFKTRPDVVLFGERLNSKLFKGVEKFAVEADYIIAVGTSLNVFPAASLVMDRPAKSIIVNRDKTPFNTWVKEAFTEDADVALPKLLERLNNA